MTSSKDITPFRKNWQKEIDGTALYNTLAEIEPKPELADVYRRLAASEVKHAEVWEKNCLKPMYTSRPGVHPGVPPPCVSWQNGLALNSYFRL